MPRHMVWFFRVVGPCLAVFGVLFGALASTHESLVCEDGECALTSRAIARQSVRGFRSSALGRPTVETYSVENGTRNQVVLSIEGERHEFGGDTRVVGTIERYLEGASPHLDVHYSSLASVATLSIVGIGIGMPMLVFGWFRSVRRRAFGNDREPAKKSS